MKWMLVVVVLGIARVKTGLLYDDLEDGLGTRKPGKRAAQGNCRSDHVASDRGRDHLNSARCSLSNGRGVDGRAGHKVRAGRGRPSSKPCAERVAGAAGLRYIGRHGEELHEGSRTNEQSSRERDRQSGKQNTAGPDGKGRYTPRRVVRSIRNKGASQNDRAVREQQRQVIPPNAATHMGNRLFDDRYADSRSRPNSRSSTPEVKREPIERLAKLPQTPRPRSPWRRPVPARS